MKGCFLSTIFKIIKISIFYGNKLIDLFSNFKQTSQFHKSYMFIYNIESLFLLKKIGKFSIMTNLALLLTVKTIIKKYIKFQKNCKVKYF